MSAAPVMAQVPQPYPQIPAGAGAPAEAKQIEGKIKTVDGGLVTLDDGTKLMIPASVKVERASLKEGATVKASYEQRAGQNIVTSIEVQ
jgi:copper chaperone CopZ